MSTAITLYDIDKRLLPLLDAETLNEDGQLAVLTEVVQSGDGDCVIAFLRVLESQVKLAAEEVKRLEARKHELESGQERIEAHIVKLVEQFGVTKKGTKNPRLEGKLGALTIATNPDSVEVDDLEQVPDAFKAVTVTLGAGLWHAILEALDENVAHQYFAADARAAKSSYSAKKAEMKKEIDRGGHVPGVDIKFGGQRLVLK